MQAQDADWCDVASRAASNTGNSHRFPLSHHLRTSSFDASKIVPILALSHELQHVIKLDLVRSNELVSGDLAVVLDGNSEFLALTVSNKFFLGSVIPDGVVCALQFLGGVNLLA